MTKLIVVIETEVPRGKGEFGDPCRLVKQYFTPDGDLIAEVDPTHQEILEQMEGTGAFICEVPRCTVWNDCVHGAGCMFSTFVSKDKTFPPVIVKEENILCLKFKKG